MPIIPQVVTPVEGRSRGRPSLFTPDRVAVILDHIRRGNYIEIACKAAGVDYATFRTWMAAGEQGDPRYVDLVDAVAKAEADHESSLVPELMESKDDSIRLRMLGRRYRDRWAEQTNINIKAETQSTVTHQLQITDAIGLLQLVAGMQPQLTEPNVSRETIEGRTIDTE